MSHPFEAMDTLELEKTQDIVSHLYYFIMHAGYFCENMMILILSFVIQEYASKSINMHTKRQITRFPQ